ncbi:hypothetical protein TWF730_001933 [Orbilia blumenaviensis]|uniref:Uncharacterized protein n=1 Tax=Orbilia blumenaviensis TaxID=1796055 RepID=A0AAV9UE05_9PEZI
MWGAFQYVLLGVFFRDLGAAAYEIAFTPYDMKSAQESIFAYKPLPELNWSVYPRFRCHQINWSDYPPESVGFVASVFFRGYKTFKYPAPLPEAVAFYAAKPNDPQPGSPCRFENLITVAHLGGYSNFPEGAIMKLRFAGNRYPTHWMEIPEDDSSDMWRWVQEGPIGGQNWRTAYWSAPDKKWVVRWGDLSESPEYWDPWYYAAIGSDIGGRELELESNPPGDDSYEQHYYHPEYSDDDAISRRTMYSAGTDSPDGFPERTFDVPPPEIIRGNPRWVYRPTTGYRGDHPSFVDWRNKRIRDAGDYQTVSPILYNNGDSGEYEKLQDQGYVIDIEAEKELAAKRAKHLKGVKEAEIFYEAANSAKENADPSGTKADAGPYDDIWPWDTNKERFQLEIPDPLRTLLDINTGIPLQRPRMPIFNPADNIPLMQPPKPVIQPGPGLKIRRPIINKIHKVLSGPGTPISGKDSWVNGNSDDSDAYQDSIEEASNEEDSDADGLNDDGGSKGGSPSNAYTEPATAE